MSKKFKRGSNGQAGRASRKKTGVNRLPPEPARPVKKAHGEPLEMAKPTLVLPTPRGGGHVTWRLHPEMEDHLENCGVPFTYAVIRASDIDYDLSLQHNPRLLKSLIPEREMRYYLRMKKKYVFNQMCVAMNEHGNYELVDGLQRFGGYRKYLRELQVALSAAFIPVCLADNSNLAALDLAKCSANININGASISDDEGVLEAVEFLARRSDLRSAEVALRFGISQSAIDREVKRRKNHLAYTANGVDVEGLSETQLKALSPLLGNTVLVCRAAEAVRETNMSGTDVTSMVSRAKKELTDKDRLRVIDECQQEVARTMTTTQQKRNTPIANFRKCMTHIDTISRTMTRTKCGIHTETQLNELREIWSRTKVNVTKFLV